MLNYRKYATTVCKIRTRILAKSEAIKENDDLDKDDGSSILAKESRIYSTRGRSSDGLSERERKHLETLD